MLNETSPPPGAAGAAAAQAGAGAQGMAGEGACSAGTQQGRKMTSGGGTITRTRGAGAQAGGHGGHGGQGGSSGSAADRPATARSTASGMRRRPGDMGFLP